MCLYVELFAIIALAISYCCSLYTFIVNWLLQFISLIACLFVGGIANLLIYDYVFVCLYVEMLIVIPFLLPKFFVVDFIELLDELKLTIINKMD